MTPLPELLAALVPGEPMREAHAKELLARLSRFSASSIRARNGQTYAIDESAREDVVADVFFALQRRSQLAPLEVSTKSEGECIRYVKTALVNRWISIQRKRGAEVLEDRDITGSEGTAPAEEAEPADPRDYVGEARALIGHAFERVLARRAATYHDADRRTLAELDGLVFGGSAIEDFLTPKDCADAAKANRALERLYQQHSRLRGRLQAAVDALEAEGAMDSRTAQQARKCLLLLVRRQNKRAPASVRQEG